MVLKEGSSDAICERDVVYKVLKHPNIVNLPGGKVIAEADEALLEQGHTFIGSLISCIIALLVIESHFACCYHGRCCMCFHFGDCNGCDPLAVSALVVQCPKVAILTQGQGALGLHAMSQQVMYIGQFGTQCLAVCAKVDRARGSNCQNSCSDLGSRRGCGLTWQVDAQLQACWQLLKDCKLCLGFGGWLCGEGSLGVPCTCSP